MKRLRRTTGGPTRGDLLALGVGVLTLAAAAVLVGVFARGWWRGTGGTFVPARLSASSTITPQSSLFADPLAAEVDVVLDPRTVDPATVQLTSGFSPFVVRSQSRSVDGGVGAATIVRFRYEIECVAAGCISLVGGTKAGSNETKAIALPPAKLTARRRNGTTLSSTVAWPPFTMHSRLTAEEAGLSTPHFASSFTPPPISWRLTPDLVGGIALSIAVVLLLGTGFVVATVAVGDTARLRVRRVSSRLTPIERALRLAEHAAASGERDEERKALQRLAVELGQTGYGDLADQASWLAWSADNPSSVGLESLAHEVRSNGAR